MAAKVKNGTVRKNVYFEPGVLKAIEKLRAETNTTISFSAWMNFVATQFIHDENKHRRFTYAPDER